MGSYTRAAYHSTQPLWRSHFNKSGPYIGIEFEIESSTGSYTDLLDLLPDMLGQRRPCTETDGSLNAAAGVEIVFPPITYKTLLSQKNSIKEAINAISPVAVASDRCGMHCNINTRGWSDVKRALFTAMIQNAPQTALLRIGGRRALNAYCEQFPNRSLPSYRDNYGHSVAENKQDRIEMRFPGATTDTHRLDIIVAFADSLEHFCRKHIADWNEYIVRTMHPRPNHSTEFQWLYATAENANSIFSYEKLWTEYLNYLRTSSHNSLRRKLLEVIENGYEAVDFDSSTKSCKRVSEGIAVAAAA